MILLGVCLFSKIVFFKNLCRSCNHNSILFSFKQVLDSLYYVSPVQMLFKLQGFKHVSTFVCPNLITFRLLLLSLVKLVIWKVVVLDCTWLIENRNLKLDIFFEIRFWLIITKNITFYFWIYMFIGFKKINLLLVHFKN